MSQTASWLYVAVSVVQFFSDDAMPPTQVVISYEI